MEKQFYNFSNAPIEISEEKNNKIATFLISVLDEYNLNNCLIDKAAGEKYYKTAIGKPIQAALKYDANGNPNDFGGHEVKCIRADDGSVEYQFCTQSVGAITDAWIEKRDVQGYDGKRSCIMVKATLWKSRYPKYYEVFDKLMANGGVSSSWEIDVQKSSKTKRGKKLNDFEFLGNCMLGTSVRGAVTGAGVVECSSEDNNTLLSNALMNDLISEENSELNKNNAEGGNNLENQEEKVIESAEQTDNTDSAEKEVASLTICDIRKGLYKAISGLDAGLCYDICFIYPEEHRCIYRVYGQNTNDDDFMEISYEIKDDVVSLIGEPVAKKMVFIDSASMNEKDGQIASLTTDKAELTSKVENLEKDIASKNDALVKANDKTVELNGKIEELDKQIAELQVCKDELDKINAEKEANELAEKKNSLKEKALKSKLISEEEFETSEDVKSAIENLDENGLNKIIANRYMDSLDSQIETSSVKNEKITKEVSAQEIRDGKSLMKNYLK